MARALGKQPAATTLPELLDALARTPPVLEAEHCFSFPEDLLARFAFHHLTRDGVAVRLGLPGAGPSRANLTQLGLELALPPALREALQQAATQQAGILMDSATKLAEGRESVLRLP